MARISKLSVWDYKPWWCQPWSIVLTGIIIIAGSWWLLHRYWVTAVVAVTVLLWMGFYLLVYPSLAAAELPSTDDLSLPSTDKLPKV